VPPPTQRLQRGIGSLASNRRAAKLGGAAVQGQPRRRGLEAQEEEEIMSDMLADVPPERMWTLLEAT
jgi:hypothetical protein